MITHNIRRGSPVVVLIVGLMAMALSCGGSAAEAPNPQGAETTADSSSSDQSASGQGRLLGQGSAGAKGPAGATGTRGEGGPGICAGGHQGPVRCRCANGRGRSATGRAHLWGGRSLGVRLLAEPVRPPTHRGILGRP